MKERIVYFDFLRGIAILMVIFIHTFPAITLSYNSNIELFLRQILNCAVPIFLAISGYFIVKGGKTNNYIDFLKHQIPKVYIPCLFWSVPYFVLYLYAGNGLLKSLLYFFSCGFSIYYFIALIIQYYILSPMLIKLKSGGVILSFLLTMFAIGMVTYILQIKGYALPLIVYAGGFPVWLIFFVIGMHLGKIQRDYKIIPWICSIIFFLILSFTETKYLYGFNHGGFAIKVSSHLYSLSIIMLLFSQRVETYFSKVNNPLYRFTVYIGSLSFGIYLIHCFFIIALRRYFEIDLGWFLSTITVLLLSMGFIYIVKKIFPHLSIYWGFR